LLTEWARTGVRVISARKIDIEPVPRNGGEFCMIILAGTIVYLTSALVLLPTYAEPLAQSQPLQYDVRVINIEVPVRVFSGDVFIDNLKLEDFDVYENGLAQKIEAVYLVKKTSIERKEEAKPFNPETSRSFYLFFVLYEYNPKLREAVSYFINNVIRPDDRLVVVTPVTSYSMKKGALTSEPKQKIVDKLIGIIRKDILTGEAVYRAALSNLKRMSRSKVKAIEDQGIDIDELADLGVSSDEEFLQKYRNDLEQLNNLKFIDESKLFDFTRYLKDRKGQKYVYLFYQREFTPVLDKNIQALYDTSIVTKQIQEGLFSFYSRVASIAINRLKEACADSSISIHFLYLTTIPIDIARNQMEERSWDVYEAFSEMAKATGGLAASSSNAASLMEKASNASENYYLLYYSPKDKTADGKFRQIQVKVKSGGYRVTHLAGYYAK
jgi:hypothetical protein